MEKKKILVIGLGPVGGIFAAHLAASGHLVYAVDPWDEHIKACGQEGIFIEEPENIRGPLQEACINAAELKERRFDYAAVAVKTPNLAEVVKQLKTVNDDCRIVILQNGLDNELYFAEHFDKKRIIRMVVNYAGNIVSPGRIKRSFFQRPNYLGCICQGQDCSCTVEVVSLLNAAGLDSESTADINQYVWKKVILNAAMSPVTAVLGITMADVMNNPNTRLLMEALLREGIETARTVGYDYGEPFFDQCVKYLSGAGPHKTSMLIDLERGNPTEIDYINGKIVAYGLKFHVPVPFHTEITYLIKAKEAFRQQDERK